MKRALNRVKEECPEAFWTMASGVGIDGGAVNFMHWKGDSIFGCYIPTGDVMDAERFDSYREVVNAIKHDDDVKEFMESYPDAVPVKVVVKVEVYRNDAVRVAKHVR